jgi:hypothetical protein
MTDLLAPIADKLARFVRLFPSDKTGEIIAAAHAIVCTLQTAGADIHTLAEQVEKANGGGLTHTGVQKRYDAGYSAGMERLKPASPPADFNNANGTCTGTSQQRSDQLRENERAFVNHWAARKVRREPDRATIWPAFVLAGLTDGLQ